MSPKMFFPSSGPKGRGEQTENSTCLQMRAVGVGSDSIYLGFISYPDIDIHTYCSSDEDFDKNDKKITTQKTNRSLIELYFAKLIKVN
jgi:hypothetical protein